MILIKKFFELRRKIEFYKVINNLLISIIMGIVVIFNLNLFIKYLGLILWYSFIGILVFMFLNFDDVW